MSKTAMVNKVKTPTKVVIEEKPKSVKETKKVESDTETEEIHHVKKPTKVVIEEKPKSVKESKKKVESDTETEEIHHDKTKRAPSKYNIFIKDKIAELRVSCPDHTPQEYMKMAVAEYNIEHPKAEKPEKAEKPKKTTSKTKSTDDESKKVETKKSEEKTTTTDKPKRTRAPTAYNLFIRDRMAEIRKEEEGLKPQEYMKKAIAMWNKQKADKITEKLEKTKISDDEEE